MKEIEAHFEGRVGTYHLDVSFSAPGHGITGLVGPSGSGKTTILRWIAGLARADRGWLRADDVVWQDQDLFVAAHKRPIGYVFQEPRLFPHLSVLGNLQYGLRRTKKSGSGLELEAIIDLMGVRSLLSRSPANLSGGERQRVAVGRALLSQPKLLLMDEPLSALDRDSKEEILPYLQNLPDQLALPIIYVSHDFAEIERLADHLLLMGKNGRIQAAGPLSDILTDLSLPPARQASSAVVLPVTIDSYDAGYDLTRYLVGGLPLYLPGAEGAAGTKRRVRIAASDVSLVKGMPCATSILNILPVRILSGELTERNQMLVLLSLIGAEESIRLLASITRKSWDNLDLKPGEEVLAQIKGMAILDR